MLMYNVLAVFIGGGLGAVMRYLICHFSTKGCSLSYPFHTLSINVLGSFVLGFLICYFNAKSGVNPHLKLFLTVGFCGGLTTFSTFSVEALEMLRVGRFFDFFTYLLASVVVCIIGATIGAYFAKFI